MPWYWQKNPLQLEIAIWKIEEAESYFRQRTPFVNQEALGRYKHPQTRLHWLASRLLLHEVLGAVKYQQLGKDANGKPQARDFELSISHSEDLVAIAIGNKNQNIGIDIQGFSPKLENIAPKFIPPIQLADIAGSTYFKELVHIHWGIKEALFKAYGKGKLDFKKHLILDWDQTFNPEGATFNSWVQKENIQLVYQSTYQITTENYLLCSVTNA